VTLYTRTGDAGETSLFGGTRVSKGDLRVDAYGEVDELNASLGWALAALSAGGAASVADIGDAIVAIQRDLFALGSRLADPTQTISGRVAKTALQPADVERLEQLIDRLEDGLPPLRRFVLPGGVETAARLHVARAICRRAERRIVILRPPVEAPLLQYINRLSDLLFVMARAINHRSGTSEAEW
jgi:cob(I)alamin adenosyltransferase